MKIINRILSSILAAAVISVSLTASLPAMVSADATGQKTSTTLDSSELLSDLMNTATQFVAIKAKQLGGSHYAYTEGLSEELTDIGSPDGVEANFNPGSQMILVTLAPNGSKVTKTEEVLIDSPDGVLRDPDVSEDGSKVLFSWKKKSSDDYHLYEMTFADRSIRQLTYGSGVADMEPKYLANGNIVFNSSRCVQTVDCWKTPVSNLYICGPDGENITRVGYDQVHTTYPTTTEDGRVIYTRWDYNDRTQMWIQSVFQMNPDGTNQTELYGNNSNFPTTLLHTREVPGTNDIYISIASGHHVPQAGKLVMLDLSKGRNSKDAVTFVFPDSDSVKNDDVDGFGQGGAIYKYPYAINENEFLVSYSASWASDKNSTPFNICLMNKSGQKIVIVQGTSSLPASQIVPIKTRTMFERASMVNYSSTTGTFYIGNIYEGDGLKGIEVGKAKYLRICALDFRAYAVGATVASGSGGADPFTPIATGNGSWDVKQVLGITPIEADGSALFKVPALTPVFFQVLDADGYVIQTMRSWSTLQPNEVFSCVGCHEDKNTVPPSNASATIAMKKGVQTLIKDFWQTGEEYEDYNPYEDEPVGFDYMTEIQPILDKSCVSCHSCTDETAFANQVTSTVFDERSDWAYTTTAPASNWTSKNFNASSWNMAYAPFGTKGTAPGEANTVWGASSIWMRKSFTLNAYQMSDVNLNLSLAYAGATEVYFNGTRVWSGTGSVSSYTTVPITEQMKASLAVGENVICVKSSSGSGNYIDAAIKVSGSNLETVRLITKGATWKYKMSSSSTAPSGWNTADYNDSAWSSGSAPFGDRDGYKTSWTGGNNYIWIRKTFTISDISKFRNAKLYANTFYDDTPVFYINGVKAFEATGWVDEYTEIALSSEAAAALREGTNVLAISCKNTTGGRQIDTTLYAKTGSTGEQSVFSLESYGVKASRTRKIWPLSYLVLTDSTINSAGNVVGNCSNRYLEWVSSMSAPEMLTPYSAGASQSKLMSVIKSGHGNLTDEEIRTFAAWIDLCVPCYGTYDAGNTWDTPPSREATEEENKRAYYELQDEYARKARANGGKLTGETITAYYASGSTAYSGSGEGLFNFEVPQKYRVGDKLTVVLPAGEKYAFISLTSKSGESLVYCENGIFDYEFTTDLVSNASYVLSSSTKMGYATNVVTVRIPTDDELKEKRNLALNNYDIASSETYPHATSTDVYNNAPEFAARNIIDGFCGNGAHGTFPSQSWGPSQDLSGDTLTIDFGRDITADELVIYLRADFPHDTYFTDATVNFSDGSKKQIKLYKTADAMTFDLGGKTTSSITLSNFVVPLTGWAALMEVEVYGSEAQSSIDSRNEINTVESGKAYSLFSADTTSALTASDGTAVSATTFAGTPEQDFTLTKVGEYYAILNDELALTANGTLSLAQYNGADAQLWKLTASGSYYVISPKTDDSRALTVSGSDITLSAGNGDAAQNWNITPFKSLATTTLTNIATGAIATADSVHVTYGGIAENVTDGDLASRWQSNASVDKGEIAWVMLDFGKRITTDKAFIYWEASCASTTGYKLQTSTNGTTWNDVSNMVVSRDGALMDTVLFKSVTTRYLRVYITGMDGKNANPSIYEIELFNSKEGQPGGDDYGIEYADGFAMGIAAGMTADDFGTLTIKNKSGNVISGTTAVSTGCVITKDNTDYTVVVRGDVNCDGKVGTADFLMIRDAYLQKLTLSGAQLKAATVSGGANVKTADYLMVRDHYLGKYDLFA